VGGARWRELSPYNQCVQHGALSTHTIIVRIGPGYNHIKNLRAGSSVRSDPRRVFNLDFFDQRRALLSCERRAERPDSTYFATSCLGPRSIELGETSFDGPWAAGTSL